MDSDFKIELLTVECEKVVCTLINLVYSFREMKLLFLSVVHLSIVNSLFVKLKWKVASFVVFLAVLIELGTSSGDSIKRRFLQNTIKPR